MFTLTQIKEVHSTVMSGADFPKYIKELLSLGVLKYNIYVCDGHAEYIGDRNYMIHSEAEYPFLHITSKVNISEFRNRLKEHQQGKTTYLTFCKDSAQTGIEKWIVDILAKTCTYYDKSGQIVLEEKISV